LLACFACFWVFARMWSNPELPLDMRKIAAELKRRPPTKNSKVYVLMGSGSYAPPHKMHIAMFELARKHLEETEKGALVVGGFIVPSSEMYVNHKLGEDRISLRDRVAMSRLVCSDSSWVEVCGWGMANSGEIAFRMQECLRLSGLAELFNCKLEVLQLFGADTIIRFLRGVSADYDEDVEAGVQDRRPKTIVVLGRPGCTEELNGICTRLPLATKHLKIVPGELEDVSSTLVRQAVRNHDAVALRTLVQCESVEKYLMDRIAPIFEQRDRMKQVEM